MTQSSRLTRLALAAVLLVSLSAAVSAAPKYKALIVDGQSNHKIWPQTTQMIKGYLEETGLFSVEVATTPPAGSDLSAYRPNFAKYDVVVSNYNGAPWGAEAKADFEKYVREGGAYVSVHSANNAFPEWPAYNEMIGIGGWGERNEKWGPYIRLREGQFVHDNTPGVGGSHGIRHEFALDIREPDHPITRGLPAKWMHSDDELYDRLRGPAKNVTVLATAFSTKDSKGTGEARTVDDDDYLRQGPHFPHRAGARDRLAAMRGIHHDPATRRRVGRQR